MKTIYKTEINEENIIKRIEKLINQTYKLLPNREEGIDWKTPLETIVEEYAGMSQLFEDENFGEKVFSLLCKLRGLNTYKEEDQFVNFRRTIFECLGLMNEVKIYVSSR